MNTRHKQVRRHSLPLLAVVASVGLAGLLGLAGCGGGDSGGYTEGAVSQSDRRALPPSLLTRAAVNYSPYRTARNESELGSEVITPANVLQDLRLVQATGIDSHLPTGQGLLTYSTIDQAVAGIEAINADYGGHCRAARDIARRHFDADRVLVEILEQVQG